MRPIVFTGLLLLTLAALASGCGGGSQAESSDNGESQSPNSLLTRSGAENEDEMNAIVGGTLELDPDRGCVLLSGKPVVWPAETTLTADPAELHLPGGLNAKSGNVITGSGGEVRAARIRETALRVEGDLTTALSCAPIDSEVVVFTTRGEGIDVSPSD